MKDVKISEKNIQMLEKLGKRNEISLENLKKEYLELFQSDFIQNDESFTDDIDRHRYTMGVLTSKHGLRASQKPYIVIPIGVDCKRKTKNGIPYTNLFAIVSPGTKLTCIRLYQENCDLVREISYYSLYKDVRLCKFRGSDDLIADDRTKFGEPIYSEKTPRELIEHLGIPETTIADARNHVNKPDARGFIKKTDLRCVRGIIQYYSMSKPDAEREWGLYVVADGSIDIGKISDDGEIQKGLSVWLSPVLMNYEKYSECLFFGNLIERKPTEAQLKKDPDLKPEVSMNAFCVIPIHKMPPEEYGEED